MVATRRLLSITLVATAAGAITACHVTSRYQDTRRGETRRERADAAPRPLPPSMEVSPDGRFRFVEPFVCAMENVTELATFDVERDRPNAATLVVGVITASLGAVAAVAGWSSDDAAGSPLSYLGPAGVVVGLPLAIGPLVGHDTARVPTGTQELRTAGGEEPCGTRPLVGTRATVRWSGLEVAGAIDADGYFSASPFSFVDAFDVGRIPALVLDIEIERDGAEPLPMEVVLDAAALADARDGYFARAGIDATVEPLRKVPRLVAGELRVSRVRRDADRGLRLVLPLANDGPGDAMGVRLSVNAAGAELDGRFVYVGRVPAKSQREIDAVIPISDRADRALAGDDLELAVIVRDAHGTAPDAPVRFRGRVLSDPSR